VVAAHPDAVRGTELDPAQLRGRRDKLIARAAELLPRQPSAPEAGVDLAAQLKNAMRQNAFGDLRFSGRDPVEVIDELRASWAEVGPVISDEDREQQARFDDTVQRVLDAAGARPRPPRDDQPRDAADDDRGGRRRRDRRGGEPEPRARASDEPAGEPAGAVAVVAAAAAISPHDAITRPVAAPPREPADAQEPGEPGGVPDEAEPGWDLGEDDPTAAAETPDKPEVSTPSSTEMAGDGAVEGDGLDTGWD
jgi:hypothetical protein